ncbi:tumor necrosis factor ligand superfamily member 11 [Plakobranchus ocellatus]|uniref:Tumor necrosis factor ligand superfamily member 11 n=1 Tax=Plakobranchus ocellatus TaxID=259542 RepID=A0AAV4DXN0_9GAST|nr:tumor necrosis factor ligand superfamily member 11 [Plakobranchus ocellatus]
MAFLAGGVEYDSGRIVIPTDGYYYVYSQITFLEYFAGDSGSHRSNQSPSLSAYLYRYNILYDRDGDELLAQNSITKYPGQSKSYREYTSTLGAVFNLRRQDHIFIKVTNVTMIPPEPKSSYFGVFKI